jgi:hypothetical protein
VVNTEKEGNAVCYTVAGTIAETPNEIPKNTTQAYRICWEKGRIVSLKFIGG